MLNTGSTEQLIILLKYGIDLRKNFEFRFIVGIEIRFCVLKCNKKLKIIVD
jgi:hypothetical protein